MLDSNCPAAEHRLKPGDLTETGVTGKLLAYAGLRAAFALHIPTVLMHVQIDRDSSLLCRMG